MPSPRPNLIPDFTIMDVLNDPQHGLSNFAMKIEDISALFTNYYEEKSYFSKLNLDPSTLINPLDVLIEENSHARTVHSQLMQIFQNRTLFPERKANNPAYQALGFIMYIWWTQNLFNGVGLFGYNIPLPYQGMCYPSACSTQDINTNNAILADIFSINCAPTVGFSPIINEPFLDLLQQYFHVSDEDLQDIRSQAVGCSDDEIYSGEWRTENYVIVTLFSVIAFLILLATAMDVFEKNVQLTDLDGTKNQKKGIGHQMLKCFSLVENLSFIFSVPKGGSQRLGCLEGMRSMSMTWVVLGHHFLFGQGLLHVQNRKHAEHISNHGAGVLFEAVNQGEYSVDTFLFIGATLLSFLLLKDLDKSNGWFHARGLVRMVLFYVNRYLRITIPLLLTMLVYVGIHPLIVTSPIDAAHMARLEADSCRDDMWIHLLYINIFMNTSCIGQTWYLSCEMIMFFFSPIFVYSFWRGKQGSWQKVAGLVWWSVVLLISLSISVLYSMDTSNYDEFIANRNLPTFNFAPWGWRNQCYLIGLLTGYLLYLTKDSNYKMDSKLNLIAWIVVAVVALFLVYGPYVMDLPYPEYSSLSTAYYGLRKAAWGFCLLWVTFSCCRGYGGIVNDFLSWSFWLPISKISFMTYLFHMCWNFFFFLSQQYNINYTLWQVTDMFVPQLLICLAIGLIACITIELPFGKIQKIIIQKLINGK